MFPGLFESDRDFARRVVKPLICPVHGKRVRLAFDYDINENPIPYIRKCCCKPFAKEVAQALYDTGIFDIVYLEDKSGLTSVSRVIKNDSLR